VNISRQEKDPETS